MNSRASAFDVFSCALEGRQLIEASAGTGKTWNICGLYLRLLIERDLPVSAILVVTFTNAATAELRERIRAGIVQCLDFLAGRLEDKLFVRPLIEQAKKAKISTQDIQRRLARALGTFDEASIFTIHGFCQRALADAPFAAGVPFALELVQDDGEMVLEVAQDFWRQHVAGSDCNRALAAWLVEQRDSPQAWAEVLRKRVARPLARLVWPAEIDDEPVLDPAPVERAFEAVRATWVRSRAEIAALLTAACETDLKKSTHGEKAVQGALREWETFLAQGNPFGKFKRDCKLDRCTASELAKATKVRGGRTPEHAFFDHADTLIAERGALDGKLALARLRLVRRLLEDGPALLRARKHDKRVLAYDDILFNLYEALQGARGPALSATLRARFPAALVDEFQDTDPVQFAIFSAIYAERSSTLFLVGDPKQAIYSFRNADLQTYLRAVAFTGAQHTLEHNQRSTPDLIQAVNAVFGANPDVFMLPGLAYHPVQRGQKKLPALLDNASPRADFSVWLLPRDESGQPIERKEAFRLSALATAGEIARLLRESRAGLVTLDGRGLEPSHIAVLVRSHREGSIVREALKSVGIGSVELAQESVFATPDAEEVERVLQAVLEPGHAGHVKGALATELLGHHATAIARIGDDESKLMRVMQRFADYRDAWVQHGIAVAYRRLLTAEDVSARMLRRSDGERRMTNLLHIGERLHEAAVTHAAPEALLRWLHAQRSERRSDDAVQLRLESDRDLVHIVTVHKSKGLEYPIVFCPFLWDGQARPSGYGLGSCTYHTVDGDAVIDLRGADQKGKSEDDAIRAMVKLETCAETMRLMYVALTRASHRCYLVAGCYDARYRDRRYSTQSTRSLLNWIVAGREHTPATWAKSELAPQDIDEAWLRLSTLEGRRLSVNPLPTHAPQPVRESPVDPAQLVVPTLPSIPGAWHIGSYSGLMLDLSTEAAVDHDLRVARRALTATQPPELPSDDILAFARGALAGECLHAVFERADFADAATWPAAIDRALAAFAVSGGGAGYARRKAMIATMLRDVLATELPEGIRLGALPRSSRRVELGFHFPSPRLSAAALNAFVRRSGYAVPHLAFSDLSGYLSGFIDLVFEHGGRYFIVDWKSNHLGYECADYDHDGIEQAMVEHGYHLQHLLYALALHRYLARRLRGYHFDGHFGGVLYLFVRGVRPSWKLADGSAAGVYFHRLAPTTMASLEALFPHEAVSTPVSTP